MQEAIRRAIEGRYGYRRGMPPVIMEGNPRIGLFQEQAITQKEALLDPEFWKCLGKAEGWTEYMSDGTPYTTYRRYWKDLIDHLAEGRDIESYFKELLK